MSPLTELITGAKAYGWGSAASATFFLNTTGSTSTDFVLASSARPNLSGDVYVGGYNNNIPTANILKYNKDGVIQWQKNYTSGTPIYGVSMVVDSSGNQYLVSRAEAPPGGANSALHLAKFDSSGTSQFQKVLYQSGTGWQPQGANIDSSDNVVIAGFSSGVGLLAKYNSSGTLQWQRLASGVNGIILYSAGIDSSNNIYSSGEFGSNNIICKLNSSGTLQYQRQISGSGAFMYKSAATTSNQYVNGWMVIGGIYYGLVCKFDSSGNTVWARTLGDGNNTYGYDIYLDSNENVYTMFETSNSRGILLAKYNSSGTLQWQRKLSVNVNSVGPSPRGLFVSGNNIYVAGHSKAPADGYFLTAVVPTDGSKTGTYSLGGYNYTYAASNFTDASTSITNVAASASFEPSSYTDGSVNYTVGNTTFTSSTVIL